MTAFQEADKIAGAIHSLFEIGCHRVVVMDGAWLLPNGRPFADGPILSTDGTRDVASDAGAEVVLPLERVYGDGGKRDLLFRCLNAEYGDRVIIMDADERAYGEINGKIPHGHALIIRRDTRPNDIPGIRLDFPRGDYGPRVPLIRWLFWSPWLRCDSPGRYRDAFGPIQPYLSNPPEDATPEQVCALPIIGSVGIQHGISPSDDRVVAKRAYYSRLRS